MSHLDDRPLFSSLSFSSGNRQPYNLASPMVSVNSSLFHGGASQNTLLPSFLSTDCASTIADTRQPSQPPNFLVPSSSVFTHRSASLWSNASVTGDAAVVLRQSREHPSYAINRLREKLGRGWLPPEPPYPPPPDDVPPSYSTTSAESKTSTVSSLEQNKTSITDWSRTNTDQSRQASEIHAEPPQVDSTTDVTTTTGAVDDDMNQLHLETVTYIAKRPVEREDGEISDDEPDSVSADLPPDSSGISSSNSHWNQSAFRGFRGGVMMPYRPRFPYRGHFPRARAFFRGRGFSPWRQWYDQRLARDWGAPDDEHVVDSSGVLSPQTESARKQSVSSHSPVHSPISSSDSEQEENTRHHCSSKSERRARYKLKSKHDDHPVADSTRTSVVASPEFEALSDSDKEPESHSGASKKKVFATFNCELL